MTDVKYTSDTIVVYQDLQHVRAVPKAYVKTTDSTGIVHTIWEYIANSVDEVGMRPEGGNITLGMFRDSVSHHFQIVVKDDGRGIPAEKLVDVLTKMGASGKISSVTAYRASGGQLGMGAKAAAALSSKYRAISANYMEDKISSVSLVDGKVTGHDIVAMKATPGVTAAFELDIDKFFVDGKDFSQIGYLDLVNLCRQLNVFNEKVNFRFYIYDRLLPEEYWSVETAQALGIIDGALEHSRKEVVYDSTKVLDKSSYLFEVVWKVNSGLVYNDTLHKDQANTADKLSFDVKFYLTKKPYSSGTQYFVMVNNVYLVEKSTNDASLAFMRLLREGLSKCQEDSEHSNFVANAYTFPTLLLAIDIKYNGAKFSGVTKTSFKDHEFFIQFHDELLITINSTKDADWWNKLAEAMQDDINLQYSRYYDVPVSKTKAEGRRVFMELNFPQNYHECKSADNSKCELYIVEGTSAGNIGKTRDSDHQALYETRGKPISAATSLDKISTDRRKLLSDAVYRDISKILNINASTTDMSTCRYSKIIIATDADPDGYHIAALHLSNLYILNPRLVDSGMVWVARPPLYALEVNRNSRLYIRNRDQLILTEISCLYARAIEIYKEGPNEKPHKLGPDEFAGCIVAAIDLGEAFIAAANNFNVPPAIIERIAYNLADIYVNGNPNDINYQALVNAFNSPDDPNEITIQVDEQHKMLIVSLGLADYQIALARAYTMIRDTLIPKIKRYKSNHIFYHVRTLLPGSAFHDKALPVTLVRLYEVLMTIKQAVPYRIHRYKGLGEMPTDGCYEALMNPHTRKITCVKNMGDLAECYELLGTDTAGRKALLSESTDSVLSARFIREHNL